MHFEQLPNEILLHIFAFVDCLDLVRAFTDLNTRFQTLIYQRYTRYCFNIYGWSKREFDMMCQQHLPRLCTQIVALNLCEGDINPGAIDLFFSYAPPLVEFTRLRSLTVSDLHCHRLKKQLIDQLPSLLNLRHLRLIFNVDSTQDDATKDLLIDHVWSLPELVDCTIQDYNPPTSEMFNPPSIVSSSLQRVSLSGRFTGWSVLDQLLQHTPNLRELNTSMSFDTVHCIPSLSFPKLTKWTTCISGPSCLMNFFQFVQSIPNLRHLDVYLSKFIDGHQWQQVIREHLPNLQTLRFAMRGISDSDGRLNAVMDTFCTSFWIDERRCYVRCLFQEHDVLVRTSSLSTHIDDSINYEQFRSTDPEHGSEKLFQLVCAIDNTLGFVDRLPVDLQFEHFESLSQNLSVAVKVWLAVPQFERLTSLSLYHRANQFIPQLPIIFGRTPRLRTLSFTQEATEPIDLSWLELASASIRHLILHGQPLNEEECRTLSRSPLAKQCEALDLWVDNRENILTLVHDLPTLRALRLLCESTGEELMQWLREHLPTSCFASSRKGYHNTSVQIWLW